MNSFFVSCPIHFEKELIREIENFWHLLIDLDGLPTREALPEFEIDKGGILFKCSMHLGLQINFFSRIANRVLLRHISFKSRYFDQFEKEFKKIDFTKIFDFSEKKSLSIELESSKSRLFHEKNILETITKICLEKKISIHAKSESRIFIRIFNDIVTISLDTSGEHLHFRGYRKHQGAAPIRENLAALILQLAQLSDSESKTILDPFCGAGTILFEAALFGMPQFHRNYPFLSFLKTPALFKSSTWVKNYKWLTPIKNTLIGIEFDQVTYEKARLNTDIFMELNFPVDLQIHHQNSAQIPIELLNIPKNQPLWIVTNPPYGERLSSVEVPTILKRFENLEGLQGIVVIHPTDWKFSFNKLKLSISHPFSNQGLKLSVSIFKPA